MLPCVAVSQIACLWDARVSESKKQFQNGFKSFSTLAHATGLGRFLLR